MNEELLTQIGLSRREAKVYLAALELGGVNISQIAKYINFERANLYPIVGRLVNQKFLEISFSGKRKVYKAVNPKYFLKIINKKKKELTKSLPVLMDLYQKTPHIPDIRYFEYASGIKRIMEETLEMPKNSEILAYSSVDKAYKYLQEFVSDYLEKRVKKKIRVRMITEDTSLAQKQIKKDRQELRESRLVLKKDYPTGFNNEINIFGDKIAIISYKQMMGVIIESKDLSDTQRTIFELAWENTKK